MSMLGGWLRGTWILLLLGIASVAPASADNPGRKLQLVADDTFASPDHQLRVEQYSRKVGEWDHVYEFWTFDNQHRHGFLLNRGEDPDLAGYPAGFRFSPDSQWLVRMQKLGAGSQTLFLYRRSGYQFPSATAKPLGDLAWDYFFKQPVSRGMLHDPKDPFSLDHAQVLLLKGLEENYAWMGQHWPDSRYLVISLAFDIQGQKESTPWIEGWRCVYDLKTGEFTVPPDFAENNAKAVKIRDQAGQ